jgi:hypothetical protein
VDVAKAIWQLSGSAKELCGVLETKLASPKSDTRVFALRTLGEMEIVAKELLPKIEAARLDPDSGVRWQARQAHNRIQSALRAEEKSRR